MIPLPPKLVDSTWRIKHWTETVLRREIERLSGSGLSLMPEGLEGAVTVEQMADLLTLLLLPR